MSGKRQCGKVAKTRQRGKHADPPEPETLTQCYTTVSTPYIGSSEEYMKRSDYFVLAAVLISFLLSVYLWFSGQKTEGLFTGLWVPSILGIAIYFKTIHRR
jgi:hypothetical protein